jgi:hypothetical protein
MIRQTLAAGVAVLALAAMQARAQGGGGGAAGGSGSGSAGSPAGQETGGGASAGSGAVSGSGSAQGAQAPSQPTGQAEQATKPPGNPTEVSGRVALVSPEDHELAIDAGTATTQVKVAPNAQITINGKRGALKDIHQGAQVRASLERSGDETQATKLEVTSSAK